VSSKRPSPRGIQFAGGVTLPRQSVRYFKRHMWPNILTPFGWVAILAIVGALMLGAAMGFAN